MPAFLVHRFSRGFLKFVLFFRPSRLHSQARGGFVTKSMPGILAWRPACFPVFARCPKPMRLKQQPYVQNHCAACACLRIYANVDKQLLCAWALGNSMPCHMCGFQYVFFECCSTFMAITFVSDCVKNVLISVCDVPTFVF